MLHKYEYFVHNFAVVTYGLHTTSYIAARHIIYANTAVTLGVELCCCIKIKINISSIEIIYVYISISNLRCENKPNSKTARFNIGFLYTFYTKMINSDRTGYSSWFLWAELLNTPLNIRLFFSKLIPLAINVNFVVSLRGVVVCICVVVWEIKQPNPFHLFLVLWLPITRR
jgi:hypothetical protein